MRDIRRRYNPMMDLSKFTSNKKILSKVVTLGYNQFVTKLCLVTNSLLLEVGLGLTQFITHSPWIVHMGYLVNDFVVE